MTAQNIVEKTQQIQKKVQMGKAEED